MNDESSSSDELPLQDRLSCFEIGTWDEEQMFNSAAMLTFNHSMKIWQRWVRRDLQIIHDSKILRSPIIPSHLLGSIHEYRRFPASEGAGYSSGRDVSSHSGWNFHSVAQNSRIRCSFLQCLRMILEQNVIHHSLEQTTNVFIAWWILNDDWVRKKESEGVMCPEKKIVFEEKSKTSAGIDRAALWSVPRYNSKMREKRKKSEERLSKKRNLKLKTPAWVKGVPSSLEWLLDGVLSHWKKSHRFVVGTKFPWWNEGKTRNSLFHSRAIGELFYFIKQKRSYQKRSHLSRCIRETAKITVKPGFRGSPLSFPLSGKT